MEQAHNSLLELGRHIWELYATHGWRPDFPRANRDMLARGVEKEYFRLKDLVPLIETPEFSEYARSKSKSHTSLSTGDLHSTRKIIEITGDLCVNSQDLLALTKYYALTPAEWLAFRRVV
jgi:hypothetical protein